MGLMGESRMENVYINSDHIPSARATPRVLTQLQFSWIPRKRRWQDEHVASPHHGRAN